MSLFTDTSPDLPPRDGRRRRTGWIILGVAIVGVAVMGLIPAPYVIERPGPAFNTLSKVEVDGKEVPLIDIPGEQTYPTEGSLDMLTVSVSGNRDQRPGWLEIATSWFDPSRAVVPIDDIYPEGVTVEQSTTQANVDMVNSQQQAIAAALTDLGYQFDTTLSVVETQKGSAADGLIKAGDVIQSVNGESFADVNALRATVAANGIDKPATVTVLRDGTASELQVTPKLSAAEDPRARPRGCGA